VTQKGSVAWYARERRRRRRRRWWLPVRIDWSTRSVVDLMDDIRMSAGTLSPTVKRQTIQMGIK